MMLDLILRDGQSDKAVGDAKYKELNGKRPPPEDLYQLLAYCVSLGLPSGLLIYADERPPGEPYVVERAGVILEVEGIDLTGDPADTAIQGVPKSGTSCEATWRWSSTTGRPSRYVAATRS